jgi:outer membrane protein insertion porin family
VKPSTHTLALLAAAGSLLAAHHAAAQSPTAPQPPAAPAQPPAQPPGPPPAATPGEPIAVAAALEPFENRVIREIRINGLKNTPEQLVRTSLRSQQGRPLKTATVQEELRIVTRLGRFREVAARVQPYDDQTVALIFDLVETPIIQDVQVSGNKQVTDQQLADVVGLLAQTPVDKFQIDRTLRAIEALYRRKGYYQATVSVDQKELEQSGIVVFRIREGERIEVTDIRFEGNAAFPARQLRPNIKTEEAGLLRAGLLDDTTLDQDVAALVKFYKDRGHLDVRADRTVRPSPNGREAIVTFLIEEGPVYTLRSIKVELAPGPAAEGERPPVPGAGPPPTVLTPAQAAALMPIRPGDVYSIDKISKGVEALRDAYGQMGYVDASVSRADLRDSSAPVVDLLVQVTESRPVKTGLVGVVGNDLTRDNVVRRAVDLKPDRPLDTTALRDSELRLGAIDLFAGPREGRPSPRLTVQPADPSNPGYRDVTVEVEEKNTGSIGLGAAVGSDSGVIGQFTLEQRNFDLYDTPDSFGEFITGRAFRGAGQRLNIALQPGNEVSNYSISLSDPSLLDSPYSLSGTIAYRQRIFREYDEDRTTFSTALGRRFGQRWAGSLTLRAESIDLSGISRNAPTDVFDFEGNSTLTGFGARLTRSTLDNRFRPTKGTRLEFAAERVGALTGDYDFTKLSAEAIGYLTIDEDLLGRRTILSLKTFAFLIPEDKEEVPVFERYYLGGRSFRGFAFRGVSTRGQRFVGGRPPAGPGSPTEKSNDPTGGTFAFFFGPEIEQPVFQNVISIVYFLDTGTVVDDVGFEDYRAAAGMGLRLAFPGLGPAPLAFDFGFPIVRQRDDRERVFSFSIDLPF